MKILRNLTAKTRLLFIFLAGLAILSSCGPRRIGYGVLLWSPDEAVLETGALLPVFEESRIKQTYTVPKPGTKEKIELPVWRIQFFPKEDEAENFAAEYADVRNLYAVANRRALPVREKADRLSQRIYRLRENERMKILELGTTPADENGLLGFWYKVLTEEGVAGYCFNYHLTVYDAKTNTQISVTRDPSQEGVARILTATWRPAYFREMVSGRRIDLARFRPAFGAFFTDDPREIRVVLPAHTVAIPYSRLSRTSGESYIAEGSDVQLQLRGSEGSELVVFYTLNGSRRSDIFISFEQEVEEIISAEQERRTLVLESFLERGDSLHSNAYGEISLSDSGAFTWQGFARLVPMAIPQGAQGTGRVEFSVFIGREVREAYDGVITFRFSGSGGDRTAHFFYRFTGQGTQFIHIPPANIEENIVRREIMSPLVIFFEHS